MKCKICKQQFKNPGGFSAHLKIKHNISFLDYYIKYVDKNFKIPKCIVCGKDCVIYSGITFQRTCGSIECKKQRRYKYWTEEKRKKHSIIMSQSIKNNNWKRSYRGNESEPEKKFRKIIEKYNLSVYQFYKDAEFERLFEIDFAIPSLKIGFEINGNQHYDKNGNLTNYYQKRHDIIESKEWKLIEIHYLKCYDEKYIKDIIQKSTEGKPIKYQRPVKKIKRVNKEKEKQEIKRREEIKRKKEKEIKERKKIILNSDINFFEFGWINKVSLLLNLSHTAVVKWMKKYMPEFYKNCYKRKGIIV
jgi:very-short-patch-repair endonuclease